MRSWAALAWVSIVGCSAVTRSPEGDVARLIDALVKRVENFARATVGGNEAILGDSPFETSYGHRVAWIHEETPEERQLLGMGSLATQDILEALKKAKEPKIRVRLLMLLARIGDGSAGPGIGMIAGRDGDPLVRECAFTALVLIRAKGAPDGLSTLDGMKPREPLVLWARALDGGGATRAEYLRSIEMMLSGEVVESIPGVALPTLSVTSGAHHLDLEAKVTPETENLPLDLWRLGFIKDKRAIGVLIKALAYHRSTVQHMALDVLSNLVENPPASTRDTKEYDLHTLETHARWVAWWKGKEARLYWNPRTASFGLQ